MQRQPLTFFHLRQLHRIFYKSCDTSNGSCCIYIKTAIADSSGLVSINNIPAGKQTLLISYVGYEEKELEFEFPLKSNDPVEILLNDVEEGEEAVVVTSTRISRSIKNLPIRAETISGGGWVCNEWRY